MTLGQRSECRHVWRPYADAKRIWQRCDKCGEEQHVCTHAEVTADRIAYIMRMGSEDE